MTFLAIWLFGVPYQQWRERRMGISPFEERTEPLFADPVPPRPPIAAGRSNVRGPDGQAVNVNPTTHAPPASGEATGASSPFST
jgi:hypothetical protein